MAVSRPGPRRLHHGVRRSDVHSTRPSGGLRPPQRRRGERDPGSQRTGDPDQQAQLFLRTDPRPRARAARASGERPSVHAHTATGHQPRDRQGGRGRLSTTDRLEPSYSGWRDRSLHTEHFDFRQRRVRRGHRREVPARSEAPAGTSHGTGRGEDVGHDCLRGCRSPPRCPERARPGGLDSLPVVYGTALARRRLREAAGPPSGGVRLLGAVLVGHLRRCSLDSRSTRTQAGMAAGSPIASEPAGTATSESWRDGPRLVPRCSLRPR